MNTHASELLPPTPLFLPQAALILVRHELEPIPQTRRERWNNVIDVLANRVAYKHVLDVVQEVADGVGESNSRTVFVYTA